MKESALEVGWSNEIELKYGNGYSDDNIHSVWQKKLVKIHPGSQDQTKTFKRNVHLFGFKRKKCLVCQATNPVVSESDLEEQSH